MTPRQQYWNNLRTIKYATGDLNRRMSFQEAQDWMYAFNSESGRGFASNDAAQRAYDCMFAHRRGPAWR